MENTVHLGTTLETNAHAAQGSARLTGDGDAARRALAQQRYGNHGTTTHLHRRAIHIDLHGFRLRQRQPPWQIAPAEMGCDR